MSAKPSKSLEIAPGTTITVEVPASTCNLGPGLDCIGLALNIYSRITFHVLEEGESSGAPIVKLEGGIARRSLPEQQGNLVYHLLREIWQHDEALFKRLRIVVQSDIPLGCGLGSSAANLIGALWAASVLEDRIPSAAELLAEGCQMEGHPETLAASLYGGMVICARSVRSQRIITQQLAWPDDWQLIAIIPPYTLSTADMRAVLPDSVPFQDALFNTQRVAMLVAAVSRQDEAAMTEALHDKLHEQYRESYVPELASLRRELVNEPVMGCVLSGAGSSVLLVVNRRKVTQVMKKLSVWAQREERQHRILVLDAAKEGVRQL